jgi:hypothetical protein
MATTSYSRPPEPDPDLSYWAWLAEWGRIHPIRGLFCVLALAWLLFFAAVGIGSLF